MQDTALPAKLRWRCRRGMRELDEAMLAYLENHYATACETEQQDFQTLLDWQDPELYRLICARDKDVRFQPIIDKIAATLGSKS